MACEKTCANCERLGLGGMKNAPLAFCKETDFIVPHSLDENGFTFWRIPRSCPREDVQKADEPIARSEWQYKTVDEMAKAQKAAKE